MNRRRGSGGVDVDGPLGPVNFFHGLWSSGGILIVNHARWTLRRRCLAHRWRGGALLALRSMTPLSRNDLREDAHARASGFAVVATVLIGFLAGTVVSAILVSAAASVAHYHGGLVALTNSAHPPAWSTVATLVGLWVGYIGGFVVARRFLPGPALRELFALRWSDALYLVVGVVLQLAVVLAYAPFQIHHFSAPTDKIFSGASGIGFVVLCALTATVVPLLEELFFRATLVPGLRQWLRRSSERATIALVVVADGVLFALAHGELAQFAGLAVVGALLAYLFIRSSRLAPSVITHAAFNATALVSVIAHRLS